MEDVLTVGSKNYVKASVIARELGYTTDYVGQLCRANKVDAKLFGRSWYVEKDSILGHKSNRYRTTAAKSIKAIREIKPESKDEKVTVLPIATKKEQRFYIHNSLKPSPRYTVDDSELLPQIQKKQGNLRVNLADASPVNITSESEKYIFDTPKMPVIKFKGSLTVTETSESVTPEGGLLLHPKEVTRLVSERRPNNKVISHKQQSKSLEEETKSIVPTELDPDVITKIVHSETVTIEGKKTFPFSIVISTVASLSIVFLLLGLETHVNVLEMTQVTEYVFRIHNLLASVYSAI